MMLTLGSELDVLSIRRAGIDELFPEIEHEAILPLAGEEAGNARPEIGVGGRVQVEPKKELQVTWISLG